MLDVLFDMVLLFGWLKRDYSILSSATSREQAESSPHSARCYDPKPAEAPRLLDKPPSPQLCDEKHRLQSQALGASSRMRSAYSRRRLALV